MALLITRTCLGDQILVSAIIDDSANIDFGKLQLISDSRAEIAGGHLDPPPSLPFLVFPNTDRVQRHYSIDKGQKILLDSDSHFRGQLCPKRPYVCGVCGEENHL